MIITGWPGDLAVAATHPVVLLTAIASALHLVAPISDFEVGKRSPAMSYGPTAAVKERVQELIPSPYSPMSPFLRGMLNLYNCERRQDSMLIHPNEPISTCKPVE